jgi:hypothetical protein
MNHTWSKLAILIPAMCAMIGEPASAGPLIGYRAPLVVTKSPSTSVNIERFDVFELTLTHSDPGYTNPFWNIDIAATFTSPGGVDFEVGGFYYDDDTWKVRFSPNVEGTWTYSLVMSLVGTSDTYVTSGGFACVSSTLHGRPRVHPDLPTRLVAGDGTPFHALGTNAFAYQHPFLNGSNILGATFKDKWDTYFDEFASHGCNTFRRLLGTETEPFPGPDTVSHLLLWWNDTGTDKYSIARCKTFDDFCDAALTHDIRLICAFYDKPKDFTKNPLNAIHGGPVAVSTELYDLGDTAETELHEKYMTYIINRYGAYVHTWQLFNEYTGDSASSLDLPWQEHMATHIRDVDPYDSFVCNSSTGTAPTATYQDIRAPHMYLSDPADKTDGIDCDGTAVARKIDESIRQEALIHSGDGLPSNFDEFGAGNGSMPTDIPDAWRVAVWAAYFCDTGITFWDNALLWPICHSFGFPGSGTQNANAYISDATRDYFLIRNTFADKFSQALTRVTPTTNDPSKLRAFGLTNTTQHLYAAYVHNYRNHGAATSGKTLTILIPNGSHVIEWIDPKTGSIVSGPTSITSTGGSKTLNIPTFTQDIALALRKDAAVNIVTGGLPAAVHGTEYQEFVEASGGGMPYTWSISAGTLPPGLQLDPESGQISGSPKFPAIYIFTVRVVAADSSVDTQQLSITTTVP